jgi:SNF2 family DNA or RNA helicase
MTGCQLTWAAELDRRIASQYDVLITDLTHPGYVTVGKRAGLLKKTMPSIAERNLKLREDMSFAADLGVPHIILANFELLRWRYYEKPKLDALWENTFDAVIIDEAHLVLPTRDDAVKDMSQFWYGLSKLAYAPDPLRLPMTGTPDRGKLENRYGHWKFLRPDLYRDFWAWARSEFVVTAEDWGGVTFGKLLDAARWGEHDTRHLIRRTKAEMFAGLPEKQWADEGGVDLPMTAMQAEAYEHYEHQLKQLERDLEATVEADPDCAEGRKAAGQLRALPMQFDLRSRQMAICTWDFIALPSGAVTGVPRVAGPDASNKLAWLYDFLEARGHTPANWDASLGKVVVTCFFSTVLHWLKAELAALDIQAEILDGATPPDVKQQIEADFQRGSLRVVLLSGDLAVSINLDAADDMVFVGMVHDPDKMEQAEDRIHRASRMHQVTYWRLCSVGTADQALLMAMDSRYEATRRTYEGNRGVAFARRMLGLGEAVHA